MNCNETIIIGLNEISKASNHMVLLNKTVNIHLVIKQYNRNLCTLCIISNAYGAVAEPGCFHRGDQRGVQVA